MADRFYTPEPIALGDFTLDGPEAHHLIHVRRFAVGDSISLFNGDGCEYAAEILSVGKKQALVSVQRMDQPERELDFVLHLASALPKGDRSDFLIEKLTELGVTDFTPLLTARSVVQPKPSAVEKFQRAVIEASKQCGRNILMRVHSPIRLEAWCEQADLPVNKWIAHPDGKKLTSKSSVDTAVAIGPEGGFTTEEIAQAEQAGFERVSLGPRILRVETAALALACWC